MPRRRGRPAIYDGALLFHIKALLARARARGEVLSVRAAARAVATEFIDVRMTCPEAAADRLRRKLRHDDDFCPRRNGANQWLIDGSQAGVREVAKKTPDIALGRIEDDAEYQAARAKVARIAARGAEIEEAEKRARRMAARHHPMLLRSGMNDITATAEDERRDREARERTVAAILAGVEEMPATSPIGSPVELEMQAAAHRAAICEANDRLREIEGKVAYRLLKAAEPTDAKNVAAVVEAFERFMEVFEATMAFRDELGRRRLSIWSLPPLGQLFAAVGHRDNWASTAAQFLRDPQIAPHRRGGRRAA